MIFAFALALFALPQEPAPNSQQQEQKPSAEEIQLWWNGLSEKEQGEYRQRMKRYEELKPTLQEELGRRHGLLHEERQRIKQDLTDQERKEFDALGKGERRQFLDDRATSNMRQRGQRLEQNIPDLGPPSPEEDWTQRRERVAKVFEQQRAPQVREAIAQAVADGWIGASAAKWLETAPIYEAMSALGEVRKWQFLQEASEKGLWEQMGFDEQRRREFAQMPAMDFFRTMRGHREGRQRGPGGFGKFGEDRGDGLGPDGQRGPRQGRRGGERGFGDGNGSGSGPGRRRGGGPGGPPSMNGPPPDGQRPPGPPPQGTRPPGPPPKDDPNGGEG